MLGSGGYGQKDPLSEYKNEAFRAFEEMMIGMRSEVCTGLFRSSTNLAAFENMLSSLSGVAKATGPDSGNAGFDKFGGGQGSPGSGGGEKEPPQIATPVVREYTQGWSEMILVLVEVVKSIQKVWCRQ